MKHQEQVRMIQQVDSDGRDFWCGVSDLVGAIVTGHEFSHVFFTLCLVVLSSVQCRQDYLVALSKRKIIRSVLVCGQKLENLGLQHVILHLQDIQVELLHHRSSMNVHDTSVRVNKGGNNMWRAAHLQLKGEKPCGSINHVHDVEMHPGQGPPPPLLIPFHMVA
jgi:hypothetical protein